MKKILKYIIKSFLDFFINIMSKINYGRFILDETNKSIINRKKIVVHKDIELKFHIPNRLSHYRVDTFNSKEPETLEWIDNFEKKNIFWDIGANIGLYSCYAAKKKLCKVFAFEPSIFNLEWLGKNIFLNNLVNDITVIPIPLNKKKSESILNFSSTDWSGALSAFGQTYGHDGKDFKSILQYPTVGFSIDDAKNLLNIPQPDYIKIDVDGIEHLILMGGEEVLLKTKQLLIEVNDNFEEQKQSCIKSLTKMGFKLKEKRKNDILKNSNFSSTFNQIWVKQL